MFYAGIIIVDYYREQAEIILKNLIESNINLNISIFYERQDTYKIIKELTYHIGNVGVEVKSSNENRQDIDIATSTYSDAKYIRREMQINNEEMYFLYIYLNTIIFIIKKAILLSLMNLVQNKTFNDFKNLDYKSFKYKLSIIKYELKIDINSNQIQMIK